MNRGRNLRRLSQIVFLVIFLLLLRAANWPLQAGADVNLFLRADPLAALVTALALPHFAAAGQLLYLFIPALVLLVLTALFGRFFCGWICPLGTCLDIFHAALVRPFSKRDSRWANWPQLKYYILLAVLIAALSGTQIAWFLDPIPLTTRTFATVLHSALLKLQNWLVAHPDGPLGVLNSRLNLEAVRGRNFALAWPVLGFFAFVLALGFVSRRYWCRNLCPLGAMLAFVGRHGIWRRQVAASCLRCKRCVADCKMGAIPADEPSRTRTSECILCYNCVSCPQAGITRIGISLDDQGLETGTNVTRRRLLGAVGVGVVYGLLARSRLFGAHKATATQHQFLIRPPGAIVRDENGQISRMMTEVEFQAQCLRCGECMKACLTNVIQPALLEGGFDGLYTPVMVGAAGWCEQSCNLCGQVCPSGALRPFTPEEKAGIQIAEARIDHSRCLSWAKGDDYLVCLVCDEMCSYNAITAEDTDGTGQLRPLVHPDICVGCGICEYNCPLSPQSAIRIYRREDQDAT